MEKIDFTALENAYKRLIEVIGIYNSDKNNLIVRDSMMHRFEYTYSLSLKMIKRYFSASAFSAENIDGMSFNEMIRVANRMGLLESNLEIWDVFRQKRNATSHTYNEETALEVVEVIENFAKEVEFLLARLKESQS